MIEHRLALGAVLLSVSAGCSPSPAERVMEPATPDQGAAVHELLEALGLDGTAEEIPSRLPGVKVVQPQPDVTRFAASRGIVIREISVPPRREAGPPRDGIDLLRTEVADADRFHLLYSEAGRLQAILPAERLPTAEAFFWFMDLTPYHVDLGRLGDMNDDELQVVARSIGQRREAVMEYIQFRRMSDRIRPIDGGSKKPYVLVTLDGATGTVGLEEFGPADLLDDARRAALRARFRVQAPGQHLIYPVFPTVYSPAIQNNRAQALNFGGHVHRSLERLNPEDGDRILDVGTGSGYLSWVAWATARAAGRRVTLYAIDINPLAVANARAMARLAGIQLTAVTHDNVVGAGGEDVFPGTRFRLVIWDMPALPRLVRPLLSSAPQPEPSRRLMSYWDGSPDALESLERFASALPRMLAPRPGAPAAGDGRTGEGTAVVWNALPVDDPDIIQRTFEKAGAAPRLLETYTASNGTVTCVVLAVSMADSPPPRERPR